MRTLRPANSDEAAETTAKMARELNGSLSARSRMRPRPASMLGSPSAGGVSGTGFGAMDDEEGAIEDEETKANRRRRNGKRMSMLEFLSAEPAAPAGAGAGSSGLGYSSSSAGTGSASIGSGAGGRYSLHSSSPQQSSLRSAPNGHAVSERMAVEEEEADGFGVSTPIVQTAPIFGAAGTLQQQQQETSQLRSSPQDTSQSPSSSSRSADPRLSTFASAAAATSSASPTTIKAGKQRQLDAATGSHSASAAAADAQQQGWSVKVEVRPLSDVVTMFGTSQTTAKYSLSGSVVLTIPRRKRPNGAAGTVGLGTKAGAVDDDYPDRPPPTPPTPGQQFTEGLKSLLPSIRLSHPDGNGGSNSNGYAAGGAKGAGARGNGSESSEPEVLHLRSIQLVFTGYSVYFDPAGRFSGLKLADVTQELIPNGAVLPLRFDPEADASTPSSKATEPLKYEIEFDLAIPGCLPASLRSPFGATFYTLRSSVRYFASEEHAARAYAASAAGATSPMTPVGMMQLAPGMIVAPPLRSSSTSPSPEAASTSSRSAAARREDSSSGQSPPQQAQKQEEVQEAKQKEKGKGSAWLTKLIASTKTAGSDPNIGTTSSSSTASRSSASNHDHAPKVPVSIAAPSSSVISGALAATTPRRRPKPLVMTADGSKVVDSAIIAVLVKRCRDVIPVPVARLAHGEMEGIATDPPPQTHSLAAAASGGARRVPPRISSSDTSSLSDTVSTRPSPTSAVDPTAPAAEAPEEQPEAMETMAPEPNPQPEPDTMLTPIGSRDGKRPVLYGRRSSLTDRVRASLPPTMTGSAGAGPQVGSSAGAGSSSTTEQQGAPGHMPMRHFLHRPVLHPPTEAATGDEGLPFLLTVSVPTHVHTASDLLNFAIQVDLSEHVGWAKVRALGGLRLRHMELLLTQSERHR